MYLCVLSHFFLLFGVCDRHIQLYDNKSTNLTYFFSLNHLPEAHPCDNLRRDWRTLTLGQQATYISAVNQLMNARQYPSWLSVHTNPAIDRYAHNSDGFYPWHRWYLWNFENQLRALGGVYSCVSIPYWDWTADSATYGANMQASMLYRQFGGAGAGQCVEQLPDPYGQLPFSAFAAFRYPNDPAGRFPGGCVRRMHRYQRIPLPFEMLDILTRNAFYTQGKVTSSLEYI